MDRLFSVEIDASDVACFIFEAVQGEGGFLAMEPEFAQALRRFCDEKGILIIIDEIQSGFGRTGQRFAFSRLGIEPDLLLVAKSIAGGIPLGAVLGRKTLLDALPKGTLGGTYSGNPIGCAAGLATLAQMTDDNLSAWGESQEEAIVSRYQSWQEKKLSPYLGRLTGVGAMRGIELLTPEGKPATQQLAQLVESARNAGLLLMPSGKSRHIIRLLAPLTIEPEILNEGLDILENCLAALARAPHSRQKPVQRMQCATGLFMIAGFNRQRPKGLRRPRRLRWSTCDQSWSRNKDCRRGPDKPGRKAASAPPAGRTAHTRKFPRHAPATPHIRPALLPSRGF
jgi:4-aminobutyrate aminotransferase-like enzyme